MLKTTVHKHVLAHLHQTLEKNRPIRIFSRVENVLSILYKVVHVCKCYIFLKLNFFFFIYLVLLFLCVALLHSHLKCERLIIPFQKIFWDFIIFWIFFFIFFTIAKKATLI